MTWVRLDDDFPSHRKIRRLSDAAFRLQVSGLCWASKYTTDGRIAADELTMVTEIDDRDDPQAYLQAAAELVDRNVWHTARHDCPTCPTSKDGWVIHDYLGMNPSAVQVKQQREQAAERQRKSRERRHAGDDENARVSHTDVTPSVTRVSQRPTPTPTPNKKKTPSPRGGDGAPAGFAEFWLAYPRKAGKAAAVKAYERALKNGTAPEQILTGAQAYAADGVRQRAEPQYTKHPATWLNAGCWDDEPLPMGTSERPPAPEPAYYRPLRPSRAAG